MIRCSGNFASAAGPKSSSLSARTSGREFSKCLSDELRAVMVRPARLSRSAQSMGHRFDGINIGSQLEGTNTVTKFRARDGAPRGSFNVGSVPIDIMFDARKYGSLITHQ
jgi:hypothetical protein